MLIFDEVNLERISKKDLVGIELRNTRVTATVVDTDPAQGIIRFVPLLIVEPSENGTGSRILAVRKSETKTIRLGNNIKVFKAMDSEATVTYALTWERIAELEPKVLILLDEIQAESPAEYNYDRIWNRYKERLSELVGWDREATSHPELRSSRAYDVVYSRLLCCLKDAAV